MKDWRGILTLTTDDNKKRTVKRPSKSFYRTRPRAKARGYLPCGTVPDRLSEHTLLSQQYDLRFD